MATINALRANIAAGQFLSNAIELADNFVVGLIMPPAWTNARLKISVAPDDIHFFDLFTFHDVSSTSPAEFMINVTPNAMLAINPDTMLMARYLKLRSGTRDEPVLQAEARQFGIVTVNRVSMREGIA